jgi:hypothetical protein
MDRRLLQAMVRVTDFLAGSRQRGWRGEDVDGSEMSVSRDADKTLRILRGLHMVKIFVLKTFRSTFPDYTFQWNSVTDGDGKEALDVLKRDGSRFPAVRLRCWKGGVRDMGFWFYLDCDFGIVDNVMHEDRGHHMVSFEQDNDDGPLWKGIVAFDSAFQNIDDEKRVENKASAYEAIRDFMVGQHAQGMDDCDSSDASVSTASSPRTPL